MTGMYAGASMEPKAVQFVAPEQWKAVTFTGGLSVAFFNVHAPVNGSTSARCEKPLPVTMTYDAILPVFGSTEFTPEIIAPFAGRFISPGLGKVVTTTASLPGSETRNRPQMPLRKSLPMK